ncbi:MAG TPA: VWA domain-containing protein, partial [Pirellulaceae bacterium]|nr:VWA domain-containing protein [Pirellulaceae bacterium]
RVVSTIGLTPDADVPGIYRGRSGSLDEGEYEVSVRASGYSQDALKARSQFVVLPVESSELENTASNEALLQQMAAESGGVFLREEQMGKLSALLSPLSNGRVVETDTLLWQSYWWFAAIIFLLTLEWFLRKRAGLL